MAWSPDNLRVKGALAAFHQALEAIPTVWDKHAMMVQSTSNSEQYTFPGFVPEPRQFLNSRQFQGMRDFTYTVENNEYELSMILNRTHWEDDQNSLMNARMSEMAEVWATYKDSLFATLLAAGNVSGNNSFDGTTFHSDDHSAGTTGQTNDNNLTMAAATGTTLIASEALTAIETAREAFQTFTDDQGRPFNQSAITNMRVICHPDQERAFYEAMNATMVGASGGETTAINAFLQGVDVLPYIASGDSDEIFFSALGSVRKPFIYQERTPLEVQMLTGADDVALHNGVMVLTRQRFILTYGDHRRSILTTIT